MRLLTVSDVIRIHAVLIATSGGSEGIRDQNMLASAVAQPSMTFDGKNLYPTLIEKASAIGFALVANHPFVDGNKRVGHASIEAILMFNNFELQADVDDAERIILSVASGDLDRNGLTAWVREHTTDLVE
jgi:death on curing protein